MVHYQILQDQLKIYYDVIKQARNSYFDNLISNNKNNPQFFFFTIDHLINPDFNKYSRTSTDSLCKEFAVYFRSKTDVMRADILSKQKTVLDETESCSLSEETLESFVLDDAAVLTEALTQVSFTTCL